MSTQSSSQLRSEVRLIWLAIEAQMESSQQPGTIEV